ncbi:BA75_00807T0 [Komagataella pastoris]|uniref:BA75_00807T0 n=1 Tax=Komagataella pastoris TaxID=4922 RepID=A0A1B2J9C4_PICPA|nr:BA75_00807T0 [Komagataella pastoris]
MRVFSSSSFFTISVSNRAKAIWQQDQEQDQEWQDDLPVLSPSLLLGLTPAKQVAVRGFVYLANSLIESTGVANNDIVEIGMGKGYISRIFASSLYNYKILGIDVNGEKLRSNLRIHRLINSDNHTDLTIEAPTSLPRQQISNNLMAVNALLDDRPYQLNNVILSNLPFFSLGKPVGELVQICIVGMNLCGDLAYKVVENMCSSVENVSYSIRAASLVPCCAHLLTTFPISKNLKREFQDKPFTLSQRLIALDLCYYIQEHLPNVKPVLKEFCPKSANAGNNVMVQAILS